MFNSLGDEVKGKTIGLGGDGRYYNKEAAQIIIKMAAANGVKKVPLHAACMLSAVAKLPLVSMCCNAWYPIRTNDSKLHALLIRSW